MRNGAVAPQVQIPFKGFHGQLVFVDFVHQPFEVGLALAAAYDFTVAFGGQDIHAFGPAGVVFVALHIKGLDFVRPVVHHDGGFEEPGQNRFVGSAKVVAGLKAGGAGDPLGEVAFLFFGRVQALAGGL